MVVSRLRPPSTAQTLQPPPQMREDSAALQDSSVVAGHYAERGGKGESMETVAADAQRIPCFRDRQAPAPGRERRVEVGVEGHALARVRPTHARGTRESEGYRLVQGCERHQCIQFREHGFVELAGVVQVTAMYDSVHHHVGAGPRLRQCLEQGGKALLRIHADWNFGPGALEQTRLRAVSLSVEQIGRALEGGRANVECKKPARGHRCPRIMFMGTARPGATTAH